MTTFDGIVDLSGHTAGRCNRNADKAASALTSLHGAQVSNYRSNQSLDEYLKAQGVMGIADVDTRAITRRLRTNGCLNGVITTDDSLTDEELIAKTRVRGVAAIRQGRGRG